MNRTPPNAMLLPAHPDTPLVVRPIVWRQRYDGQHVSGSDNA